MTIQDKISCIYNNLPTTREALKLAIPAAIAPFVCLTIDNVMRNIMHNNPNMVVPKLMLIAYNIVSNINAAEIATEETTIFDSERFISSNCTIEQNVQTIGQEDLTAVENYI